jgi:hypothetical protein
MARERRGKPGEKGREPKAREPKAREPKAREPKAWESADGGSEAQRRYLLRGVNQPGGKLPLFDELGQEIPKATIRACIAHGWAEAWSNNPIHPDWLVCRLTDDGYRVMGHDPAKKRRRVKF